MTDLLNPSVSYGSNQSLVYTPLQISLLSTTGTRVNLVLDKTFLSTYQLPYKDTDDLTIGSLKQIIYDEWTAQVSKLAYEAKEQELNPAELGSKQQQPPPTQQVQINANSAENKEAPATQNHDPLTNTIGSTSSTGSLTHLTTSEYPPQLKDEHDDTAPLSDTDSQSVLETEPKSAAPAVDPVSPLSPPESQPVVASNLAVNKPATCYTTRWAYVLALTVSPAPTSPDHIRLIHFGKVLNDDSTMADCNFVVSKESNNSPNLDDSDNAALRPRSDSQAASFMAHQTSYVIHMSVRPSETPQQSKRWGKSNKKNRLSQQGMPNSQENGAGAAHPRAGSLDDGIEEGDGSSRRACCIIC